MNNRQVGLGLPAVHFKDVIYGEGKILDTIIEQLAQREVNASL